VKRKCEEPPHIWKRKKRRRKEGQVTKEKLYKSIYIYSLRQATSLMVIEF
jgi:hypothetical protein